MALEHHPDAYRTIARQLHKIFIDMAPYIPDEHDRSVVMQAPLIWAMIEEGRRME